MTNNAATTALSLLAMNWFAIRLKSMRQRTFDQNRLRAGLLHVFVRAPKARQQIASLTRDKLGAVQFRRNADGPRQFGPALVHPFAVLQCAQSGCVTPQHKAVKETRLPDASLSL
jgi:hypothetical protein